jgi:hypothetical protein
MSRYQQRAIISTGEAAIGGIGSRGSDEAAIFARELTIRVMRASLISQLRSSLDEGADLTLGQAREIVLDGEIAVPDDRGVMRRALAG